ncbi:capsule polysaccharide biosynthesis protein [Caballeronia hypogeia]|uniref:Capsule polysaccharide biosynthesis protein n=1 Tax=Caballeronia hypogeia TaxID=1777140 RepID=A0A158AFS8_9BURK|nr:capsular biosynthesis protein [Caballeronia hypogeia]SAK56486.1 capsule polysaccharide biosynthesis protein [Caballeronia hypogeia]
MRRTILFLQGPPSLFWRQLSEHFESAEIPTHRINFSLGDWAYWRKPGAVNYRGRFSRWADFLRDYLVRHKITDILYYADRLPYHAVAREVAESLGVRTYAVEFGYLRPAWLTLERGGMGTLSHFPNDPDAIRAIARRVGPLKSGTPQYSHTFGQEAFNEVFYNLLTSLVPYFFPLYRTDKFYLPLIDYLNWLPRMALQRLREPARVAAADALRHSGKRYWMLALQMQADYQLRANSAYDGQRQVIEQVISSFAQHAPQDGSLVVKLHPLDNGMERWERYVARTARRHGVASRVIAVSDCDLKRTIKRSLGVVTVNSTVGLHALRANCPVKVLGMAMYDIAGLTHQDSLETFWTKPQRINKALLRDFVSAIAATIQIQGSFYHAAGRKAACIAIVRRVLSDQVNDQGAFVQPPPRLERALASGVPIFRSLRGSGVEPASAKDTKTMPREISARSNAANVESVA